MENLELVKMFSEGISVEEISTISNLQKIKDMIIQNDFNSDIKEKLLEDVQTLTNETLWHSQVFTNLLKELK